MIFSLNDTNELVYNCRYTFRSPNYNCNHPVNEISSTSPFFDVNPLTLVNTNDLSNSNVNAQCQRVGSVTLNSQGRYETNITASAICYDIIV